MTSSHPPLVSVLMAVRDGARFLNAAVASVLDQTVDDLELVVVDDASTDATSTVLAAVRDPRLHVLRNEEHLGLAASLNRAIERSRGTYLARLDADDIACRNRLERQLTAVRAHPALAALGTGVIEIGADDAVQRLHAPPMGRGAVRWRALFSSPFFHPTVLLVRAALDRHALRYDPSFAESEDYDLWARLLGVAEADNIEQALVLLRAHPGQASVRRRNLQRSCQRTIALREIAALAPALSEQDAALAWCVAVGEPLASGDAPRAARSLLELLEHFERTHGERAAREARPAAVDALARLARLHPAHGVDLLRAALSLEPALPVRHATARIARLRASRRVRAPARRRIETVGASKRPSVLRVVSVSPEPTPYRSPLFDRIAARDDIDLVVVYAAQTVAGRTWEVEPRHRTVFLSGRRIPGARRILRHDYPVTFDVAAVLRREQPDCVVVSGWSTFASQAAILWCLRHSVPYVLIVESHDRDARSSWRRIVKGSVVPQVASRAAEVLVTGSLARESMIAHGAPPERIHVFANTIDVDAFGARADRLSERRLELRRTLGLNDGDVAVLSVARLAGEKALDILLRAAAAAGPAVVTVLVGDGAERDELHRLAASLGVRAVMTGDLEWTHIVEAYVACDIFALLSRNEPWGVVVNEAAACGLPLVLSDHVGAAPDLLHPGENGFLVPVDDVETTAHALRELAADPVLRARFGARSREIVANWGYGPSVEGFVTAVKEAVV